MEQMISVCLIVFSLGVGLQMLLRLYYGARGPQFGDPFHGIISVVGWILIVGPLVIIIVAGSAWLSLLLLAVAAFAGLELILARRAMQRRGAWELLTGELGSGQPLPEMLRSHSSRFSGIVGESFRQLVYALEQGSELTVAIGRHRQALPRDAQAYAATGAVVAAEPTKARRASMHHHSGVEDSMQSRAGQQLYQRFSYLCSVLFIMWGVLIFLMVKIIPSYQAIFDDFGLALPSTTVLLISVCDAVVDSAAAVVLSIGFFGTLFIGVLTLFLYLCDVAVLQPITDQLFFTKHRALVLRLFAAAAERGQTFADLLQRVAYGYPCYPSRYVLHRLRRASQATSAGQDWKVALQQASFLKAADFPVIETAQSAGNLPWVLRTLADQKVRAMFFRWSVAERIVFPLCVLLVGLLVMLICVALFVPLVDLILNLA